MQLGEKIYNCTRAIGSASFDDTPEAEAVRHLEDRLRNDADLVTRLMFEGYEGPDWVAAANWLVAYGRRSCRRGFSMEASSCTAARRAGTWSGAGSAGSWRWRETSPRWW